MSFRHRAIGEILELTIALMRGTTKPLDKGRVTRPVRLSRPIRATRSPAAAQISDQGIRRDFEVRTGRVDRGRPRVYGDHSSDGSGVADGGLAHEGRCVTMAAVPGAGVVRPLLARSPVPWR
jgi:hypothetical protein